MPTFPLRRLAAILPVVAALAVTSAASAATSPPDWKPFAPDSTWNLPLRSDAPVSSASASQVTWLRDKIASHSYWINSSQCGMPIYWAPLDTPLVKVALHATSYQDRSMIRAWSAVPIPPDAKPANCTDKNFTVMQTQADGTVTAWEFWSAIRAADGSWSAKWGGVTQDVLADRGVASTLSWRDPQGPVGFQNSAGHWNVTASSVAMAAGVITLDDMARGSIDHAVSMAVTDAAKGQWSWPAQRSDGASTDASAIPEGAHLRIDPSVDLDAMTMTPLVRMIARAAQRYGIIVRDRTLAANVFYVEEPHVGQTNPVRTLLNGKYPDAALAAFPWSRLQVLSAPTCSTIAKCTVTPKAIIDVDTASPKAGERVDLDTTNSVLEHPRQLVEWDFDGDGVFESSMGRQVKASFIPAEGGLRSVGVRITTRDGVVTTGSTALNTAATVVNRPSAVTSTGFYSYSSAQSRLGSVSATTATPAIPDRYRKLYSTKTSGKFTVPFAANMPGGTAGVTLKAWVECSAPRCLQLRIVRADGTTLATANPSHNASGWVSLSAPGSLDGVEVSGLRLEGSVRNASSAAGRTSISAVSLVA